MQPKPSLTTIVGIVAMLAIITLLILVERDYNTKRSVTYNTYTIGQDTVKVNVYGEVIR